MVYEDANEILSKEECKQVLSAFDKNKDFISFNIKKYSGNVVGFLAEHYLLTILFSDKNGKKTSLNHQTFFLKCQPLLNEKQKDYIKSMGVFVKEILMYKNLISEFLKLTGRPFAPKYYFSKSDYCIVMEDISAKSYEVCQQKFLDRGKIQGALKALARFHSASIIYEELRSTNEKPYRINDHFDTELKEATFSYTEGHVRNMWLKTATQCLIELTRFFTDCNTAADNIKEFILSDSGFKKCITNSNKYRNVVCHDDLWINNMMFNEDDDCLLLDFQLTRYTPPAFDVLLFLDINIEEGFLKKNLQSLLEMYYDLLSNELAFYEIDIEGIISKASFYESVKEYTAAALVEAALYGTNVFLPSDTSTMVVSNMDTFEEFSFRNRPYFVLKDFEQNEEFRERFSNVLRPLYRMFENSNHCSITQ